METVKMRYPEMDRMEAIRLLAINKSNNPYKLENVRFKQALEMAMESLVDFRAKGEWKMVKAGLFRCSNCQLEQYFTFEKHNFCPNCGSDMREGEKE